MATYVGGLGYLDVLFFVLGIQSAAIIELSNFHIFFNRFKLRMRGIQVDNQLPLTPMPVLFRPQRVGEETDYVLKFSLTIQSNGSLDLCVYPYIGVHVSMSLF
jgi:vacuolar protein sorting-associated protein 13A/C